MIEKTTHKSAVLRPYKMQYNMNEKSKDVNSSGSSNSYYRSSRIDRDGKKVYIHV